MEGWESNGVMKLSCTSKVKVSLPLKCVEVTFLDYIYLNETNYTLVAYPCGPHGVWFILYRVTHYSIRTSLH